MVDYKELVSNGALVLDVRTPGEYRGGNVAGSLNIPLNVLPERLHELKDKSQVIITCCASGLRSENAKLFLEEAGYEQVHNAGGWSILAFKLI